MRKLQLVVASCVAVLALGAGAAVASAEPAASFLCNGAAVTETHQCLVVSENLEIIRFYDLKATAGVECSATSVLNEGWVGPSSEDEATMIDFVEPAKNCKPTAKALNTELKEVANSCEKTEGSTLEAVGVPWLTLLELKEGQFWDTIREGSAGQPGYTLTCKTVLGKITDTCRSKEEKTDLLALVEDLAAEGSEPALLSMKLNEKLLSNSERMKCTVGGEESGLVIGEMLVAALNSSGALISLEASAVAPVAPKVEQVDFTNNKNVLIDHTKGVTHKEISELAAASEEPEKAIEVNQFAGEVGETLNSVEWKAPKGGTTTKNWPIAYVQDEEIALKSRIALEPATAKFVEEELEGAVTIIGTTTVGSTATEFKAEIAEATALADAKEGFLETGTMTVSAHLPGEVRSDSISIAWKWKMKEKGVPADLEQNAGTSTHNLYLLFEAPASTIYFTVLAQETADIEKISTDPSAEQVVEGIWNVFSNGKGAPAGLHLWIYDPADGSTSQSTEDVLYYEEITPKRDLKEVGESEGKALAALEEVQTTALLLQFFDGECSSWQQALDSAAKSEGRTSVDIKITVESKECAAKECGMLINNWKLAVAGLGFPNKETNVEKLEGVEGQGVKTPSSFFGNHQVVEIGKKLYDPSYGIGPIGGTLGLKEGPLENGLEGLQIRELYQDKTVAGLCKFFATPKEFMCEEVPKELVMKFE